MSRLIIPTAPKSAAAPGYSSRGSSGDTTLLTSGEGGGDYAWLERRSQELALRQPHNRHYRSVMAQRNRDASISHALALQAGLPAAVRGHCYCGSVHFEVAAGTVPNFACFCHCDSCRRAHAAPMYQVVYVPKTAFTVTAGASHVRRPHGKPTEEIGRCFCGRCGSRLFNEPPPRDVARLGVGFFPALLEEGTPKFRALEPTEHHLASEATVNLKCWLDELPRRLGDKRNDR